MVRLIDPDIKMDIYNDYIVNRLMVQEVLKKYSISRWSLFNIIKVLEDTNGISAVSSGTKRCYKTRPRKIIINRLDNDLPIVSKSSIKINKVGSEPNIKVNKINGKDVIRIEDLMAYKDLQNVITNQ